MKNKTTQGLGNENLSSFPKHDLLKYWRLKSNVNSRMSIQYVNQSKKKVTISDLLGDKWCLQRKCTCRQHETLDCRKFYNPLSDSCHRSGKGHVWQLNGYDDHSHQVDPRTKCSCLLSNNREVQIWLPLPLTSLWCIWSDVSNAFDWLMIP
jgi:hypothetical protein